MELDCELNVSKRGKCADREAMANAQVMIVEDEPIISMVLEDMLDELGCQVVGSASSVASALELLDGISIDFAILDVSLRQENSFPIAEALIARGVPYFFSTGYGTLPQEAPEANGLLQKRYQIEELGNKIRALAA